MVLAGICVEIYARFRHNMAIDSPSTANKPALMAYWIGLTFPIDAEKDFAFAKEMPPNAFV